MMLSNWVETRHCARPAYSSWERMANNLLRTTPIGKMRWYSTSVHEKTCQSAAPALLGVWQLNRLRTFRQPRIARTNRHTASLRWFLPVQRHNKCPHLNIGSTKARKILSYSLSAYCCPPVPKLFDRFMNSGLWSKCYGIASIKPFETSFGNTLLVRSRAGVPATVMQISRHQPNQAFLAQALHQALAATCLPANSGQPPAASPGLPW
jgi:hypothetical protein